MDTSFARQKDGKLIKAQKGIDKTLPFFCPGCMQEVYAATEGKIQRPHFRHKSSNLKGCSEPENYIHWITKEMFAEFYQQTDHFWILVSTTLLCNESQTCKKIEKYKIDLKTKYPYVLVEAYDQGFKPDCMLYNNSGENLYFEVKYTHSVSQEKIDTGVPIIELHVSTEKDIEKIIEKGELQFDTSSMHKIYNKSILLPEKLTFDCKGNCLRQENNKRQLTKSFKKERKNEYDFPKDPYWSSIYKGWAKWKSGLSKTNKSIPKKPIQCQDKESKKEDETTPELKQTSFHFED